jgi:BirA family biotin operon repressor/biotin-[acetyl-CoA-carboxylase] ligase
MGTMPADRSAPPPLREAVLVRELVAPGSCWSHVRVVEQTGSTNADVVGLAGAGEPEGTVLLAESQVAGRGRLGRSWQAPPRTGLAMSVLLRPRRVPAPRLGWLPLLTGVAVARACSLPGVESALKWPNDLLVRPVPAGEWGKCGGILAEAAADAVVVGVGINVLQELADLPAPADPLAFPPTSLALAGAVCGRERLAIAVLRELDHWYGRWLAVDGDPAASGLGEAYRAHCATLGAAVTATMPGGDSLRGTATGVDPDGRLIVATATGDRHLAAGDVQHLRGPAAARP